MSDENLERIGRTLEMMDQWPSDGRPDRLPEREGEEGWSRIVAFATVIGWIESVTTHKPCDRCGTPKPDHTFFRITNAGSSALQMAKALRAEFERRQRAYAGADVDDDKFEHVALTDAAKFLRKEADVAWSEDAVRLHETADALDRINRHRTAQGFGDTVNVKLRFDMKPALAELEAAHGLIGLHVGVVNGITALYGDELEEYLTDRIGDAIDIPCHDDRKAARAVVASFESDGWIVRRKVEE